MTHSLSQGRASVLPDVAVDENQICNMRVGRKGGAELSHQLVRFHLLEHIEQVWISP